MGSQAAGGIAARGISRGESSPPGGKKGKSKLLRQNHSMGGRPKGVKSWAETECVPGDYFKEEKG